MRTGRARPEPQRPPLARAVLALAVSLAVHGAVLAAVLLAPTTSPPEPLPALLVELVREPAGARGHEPAGTEAASAPGPPPASEAVAPEAVAAARALGRDPAAASPAPVDARAARPAEPVAAQAVQARPEPPPRPVPAARQPTRVAALPRPAPSGPRERSVPSADADAEAGRSAGGPGAEGSGGAGAAGAEVGEGEPPGFAIGSADNPLPRYPSAARRRGIEGTVVLEVLVSTAGLPARVAIARSSGSELLDGAALEAVERWRFRPARRGGAPVEGKVLVPITFRLVAAERVALP